jgi:hypothetical protein
MEKPSSPFFTIDEYWQLHGFSKEEAKCMEREQIKEALEREAFYDSMDACPF